VVGQLLACTEGQSRRLIRSGICIVREVRSLWSRRQVLAELREKSSQHTLSQEFHGKGTDELIYNLLEKAEQPNTDSSKGAVEALFCTGDEAASLAESGSPHDAPITTETAIPMEQGRQTPLFSVSSAERVVASTQE